MGPSLKAGVLREFDGELAIADILQLIVAAARELRPA